MRRIAIRTLTSLALGASLVGCNLIKSQEEEPEAPPGTVVVPFVEDRDVPKDAGGQPIDKGEGPVLQALGDVAAVDLGPRKGGCTFETADGRALLISGASADKAVVGKGAIRSDGVIVYLDTVGAIGVDGIKTKPKFTNGKFTVEIAVGKSDGSKPVTRSAANLGVTGADGKRRLYSPGTWVCA